MSENMFCFQCEQTAGCKGCTGKAGVCGKTADVAKAQDDLTGALIGLSRAVTVGKVKATGKTTKLVIKGLFATITNVNFDNDDIKNITHEVHKENAGAAPDYDMNKVWDGNEDIRSLKSLILFGIRGVAAYAYHADVLGYSNDELNEFFYKALSAIGEDKWGMDKLLPIVLEVGEKNLTCMALLDEANTKTFGIPAPAKVSLKVEKGPFIVVTGHDLLDLKELLEQTKDKGINIYTHGEMLPAHAYPELNKYPHLKGNYGGAWQNQQKEFENLPAPILWTTNCLMPPKASYSDRVFTTEVVGYPGTTHLDNRDFTPVINKALELGGFREDKEFSGINGGITLTTGFGKDTVLGVADKVIDAVKQGAIRHFFLVAGCDGARKDRSYYTEFVKKAPADTVILTLACGKYRFNDLDIGQIGGLPRIMDMGQCNDAYSAIQVAVALAKAFNCSVNELPLSMVLSWYEQKAVCILLTLLYLGIENIRLGPTLPAFISPNVLNFLVEKYKIAPITTPDEDIKTLLNR